MKLKEFGFFLVVACIGLFSACSSDKDKNDPDFAQQVQGTYKGELSVQLPGAPAEKSQTRVYITQTKFNVVKLELKDFAFGPITGIDIALEDIEVIGKADGAAIVEKTSTVKLEKIGGVEVDVTVSGTIIGKTLSLNLSITKVPGFTEAIKVTFNGDKLANSGNAEAKLTKLTFDSELVLAQPVIQDGKTDIALYIKEDAKLEDLKAVVANFEVSAKATVTPASGSKIDLSSGEAKFTVVSEDGGTTTVYTVKVVKASASMHDMEVWAEVNPGQGENTFSQPVGGWTTVNAGAMFLKLLEFADRFPVTQSSDTKFGKSAARIETLDTKGGDMGVIVPKVTSGSLFTGIFEIDMDNTLLSTKFGIPFEKKPVALSAQYKYESGKVYHQCADPAKADVTTIVKDKKDEAAISAVLYEIVKEDEYLTGVDIYDETKYTAIARLKDGSEKKEYTQFTANFTYVKDYDKTKKYRLAIIASSSKDGDKFSGAPGSVLFLDDVEIISE